MGWDGVRWDGWMDAHMLALQRHSAPPLTVPNGRRNDGMRCSAHFSISFARICTEGRPRPSQRGGPGPPPGASGAAAVTACCAPPPAPGRQCAASVLPRLRKANGAAPRAQVPNGTGSTYSTGRQAGRQAGRTLPGYSCTSFLPNAVASECSGVSSCRASRRLGMHARTTGARACGVRMCRESAACAVCAWLHPRSCGACK